MLNLSFTPGSVTADQVMLCWNPNSADVALVPWPDSARLSERFIFTGLACNAYIQGMSFKQRKEAIFVEAMHLIVRDQCDPIAVHQALIALKEYCAGCSPDMPVWHEGKEYPLVTLVPVLNFSESFLG